MYARDIKPKQFKSGDSHISFWERLTIFIGFFSGRTFERTVGINHQESVQSAGGGSCIVSAFAPRGINYVFNKF